MGWVSGLISQRTFRFWALSGVLVVTMAALAGGIAFGTTTAPDPCANTATLDGSRFEIDTDANQTVQGPNCTDWLTAPGVIVQPDTASGSGDESFGNGT